MESNIIFDYLGGVGMVEIYILRVGGISNAAGLSEM